MNPKKVAQIMRPEDSLILKKMNNNIVAVTDTYLLVFFNNKEVNTFIRKWNNYSSTTDINIDKFENKKKLSLVNGIEQFNNIPNIKNVIPEMHSPDELEYTGISFRQKDIDVLLTDKKKLVLINKKYIDKMINTNNLYIDDQKEIIRSPILKLVKDDDYNQMPDYLKVNNSYLKSLIMPMRINYDAYQEIKTKLIKFVDALQKEDNNKLAYSL